MTKPRGTALIINIKKITIKKKKKRKEMKRLGSEIDVENLTDMLQSFQFNVKSETDLTAKVTGQYIYFLYLNLSH